MSWSDNRHFFHKLHETWGWGFWRCHSLPLKFLGMFTNSNHAVSDMCCQLTCTIMTDLCSDLYFRGKYQVMHMVGKNVEFGRILPGEICVFKGEISEFGGLLCLFVHKHICQKKGNLACFQRNNHFFRALLSYTLFLCPWVTI